MGPGAEVSADCPVGCFSKDTLKEKKCSTPARYWGVERAYPEGEADPTSLGGCRRHLKFDKIDTAECPDIGVFQFLDNRDLSFSKSVNLK